MAETTPMMRQYQEIKSRHRDVLLFFRLGDFYEMFESDAAKASKILNLALTHRHGVPMCGIPHHSALPYIKRLLAAGEKIAVCEQITQPGEEKGIVKRDVVEILTPGTVVDDAFLDGLQNNFIMAIHLIDGHGAVGVLDLSTGEFRATSFENEGAFSALRKELWRYRPSEILIRDGLMEAYPGLKDIFASQEKLILNPLPPWSFDAKTAFDRLKTHFQVLGLGAFGLSPGSLEVVPCGVLLDYLNMTSKALLNHVLMLEVYKDEDFLSLDEASGKNLEIVRNLSDGGTAFTLFEVLNKTKTAQGARLLKKWLLHPLKNLVELQARQNRVEALYCEGPLLRQIRERLSAVLDMERLCARLSLDKAMPKDLLAIRDSLAAYRELREKVGALGGLDWWEDFSVEDSEAAGQLLELISRSLVADPAPVIHEGRLIAPGCDPEVDRLKALTENAEEILEAYLKEEQTKTGIPQIKLKFNKIIGYFFELTKTHLDRPPEHFQRKQSLLGAERFTTERLSELEESILTAKEKSIAREKTLFLELRGQVKAKISLLLKWSRAIASLDVFQSLAQSALDQSFVKPLLSHDGNLKIVEGRHPVVEAHAPSGTFIPNSVQFTENERFFLITGPNMAGKSTFLRQAALITLMAQTGSFVPASQAHIGLVDKIFCRVGASDQLARGESTFLVEMNETAFILRNATEKSLIIMDEVGRGTSTNDGFAIAWAVSEHLLGRIRAKTLFATHYHELTVLEHENLRNFSMAVEEDGAEVVFLKKVVPGPADNSYGIYVAQLAGVPTEVIHRAQRLLEELSRKESMDLSHFNARDEKNPPEAAGKSLHQVELFDPWELLKAEIRSVPLNQTTPLQALNLLARWQQELKKNP